MDHGVVKSGFQSPLDKGVGHVATQDLFVLFFYHFLVFHGHFFGLEGRAFGADALGKGLFEGAEEPVGELAVIVPTRF